VSTNPRRFEAVFTDLEDAYEHFCEKGYEGLSPREAGFANRLIELCKDIASEHEVK